MKSITIIKSTKEKLPYNKLTSLAKIKSILPYIGKTISFFNKNYVINGYSTSLTLNNEHKGKIAIIVSGDTSQPIKDIHKLGNVTIVQKSEKGLYGFFLYSSLFGEDGKLNNKINVK